MQTPSDIVWTDALHGVDMPAKALMDLARLSTRLARENAELDEENLVLRAALEDARSRFSLVAA